MHRFAAVFFVLLAASLPARAQTKPGSAFQTLRLHSGGTYNLRSGALRSHWQPGYGVDLGAATPFYLGQLEAGAAVHRFAARGAAAPDFGAFFVFAGWGLRADVFRRVSTFGSARLGNYLFWFDDDTPGLTRENELTMGLHGRVLFQLAGPVTAYVGGTYQKTFTSTRMHLWFASTGLSYSLRTPDWLKRFLR